MSGRGWSMGGIMQATDGNFYGITVYGGAYGGEFGDGIAFRYSTGLGPFVSLVQAAGEVGQSGGILGQGFTGTTQVELNGVSADFTVVSDTYIRATVPAGATSGYVTVTTPAGVLTSNVPFRIIP
ncbi:MAG TPA: IPT/TIG domain-containing protein [Terriglobales bacterium]|nr:IPT/TIG domain-containing protein [Terriglobales bacterium]